MIKFDEIPFKVDKLFKKLNENHLLVPLKDEPLFDKISSRSFKTVKIIETKYMLLKDEEFFNKYKKFWAQFFIDEDDIYHDFIQQSAACVLSEFEYTKRFLRMILDLDKLKIKSTATLGEILNSISKNCGIDKTEINDLFNLELRDIIAHDGWFYDGKNFCYEKKNGETIRLTFEDFEQIIKNLNELMAAIAACWYQYVPNLELQRYLEKIGLK